jgi:hypothetical protein
MPRHIAKSKSNVQCEVAKNKSGTVGHKQKHEPETKREPETVEHKPEAVEHKPEAVEHKSEAVEHKSEAVEHKSEGVGDKPESVEHKPEEKVVSGRADPRIKRMLEVARGGRELSPMAKRFLQLLA